jgi:hypothetical protein
MSRTNVALIAGLLAVAAALGTVAATRTVTLGTAQRQRADAVIRHRTRQLAAYQASLERTLAQKLPALPRVPKTPVAAPAAPAATQRVVYRRPPAIVIVKHGRHTDDGGREAGDGGGGDG